VPAEHTEAEAVLCVQPGQDFSEIARPPRLTARQIEDYQICPRRYLYGTIYDFRHDDSAFLPFWQTTHATLQTLVQRMSDDRQALSREEVNDIFKLHWQTHGGANGPFARLYQRHGEEVVEQIWKQLHTTDSGEWQLRQRLTIELAGQKIDVTIDRIEGSGAGCPPARLVRTRFARKGSPPPAGTRELLYVHAGRQHQFGGTIALQTHNLSSGETQDIRISARKEQSLMSELERTLAGIERQDFTPRPDAYTCATCPFFLICPA
jgi:hypothetical protein